MSQTILIRNLYVPPPFEAGKEEEQKSHYEEFYEGELLLLVGAAPRNAVALYLSLLRSRGALRDGR